MEKSALERMREAEDFQPAQKGPLPGSVKSSFNARSSRQCGRTRRDGTPADQKQFDCYFELSFLSIFLTWGRRGYLVRENEPRSATSVVHAGHIL